MLYSINNLNIRVGVPAATIGDASLFHHVVGTYDGNAINIYLDGAPVASRPIAVREGQGKPVNAGSANLQIGKGWVNLGWGGRIDRGCDL